MQESNVIQKKSHQWVKPVITVALLFAVATAVATAYLWRQAASEADSQRKTADIATAKLAALESAQKNTPSDSSTTTTLAKPDVKDNDSSATSSPIVATIAYVHAQKGSEDATLKASVAKQEGAFARVSILTENDGGYACVLKQSENIWLVIFCGQAAPLPEVLAPWNIPASILEGLQ